MRESSPRFTLALLLVVFLLAKNVGTFASPLHCDSDTSGRRWWRLGPCIAG